MDYTPWTLLIDLGIVGLLLAAGVTLRAKIGLLQSFLVPASVIGGALGLALGPVGVGILPFSDQMGTYSSVLITLVFACLALNVNFNRIKKIRSVAAMASWQVTVVSLMIVTGLLASLLIFVPIFDAPEGLGLVLWAGWTGGFGTSAAMGQVFTDAGQPEIQSLAFTSSTVGLLIGVIGGILLAKYGSAKGFTKEFSEVTGVPRDLRTGILDQKAEGSGNPVGWHRFSPGSVDSLAFQFGLIVAISAAAYGINEIIGNVTGGFTPPVFSVAFVVGLITRLLMKATKSEKFVDKETVSSISGTSTDILIVCGIASIMPAVVMSHWVPLLILFGIGLIVLLVFALFVAPRVFEGAWFERNMFMWGLLTAATPQAIALLRIVDPRLKSGTMEDFAFSAMFVGVPYEIVTVTFVPALVVTGLAWGVIGIWGALAVVFIFILLLTYLSLKKNRMINT